MPLRMRLHDREPIGAALRRFKKVLERSGVIKDFANASITRNRVKLGVGPPCASRAPSAKP